jgi:SNF2 family DNA or RNA helicase
MLRTKTIGNQVKIEFDGDDFSDCLNAVRDLPVRRFDNYEKAWFVPVEGMKLFFTKLGRVCPPEYDIEVSNEVEIVIKNDKFEIKPELNIRDSRLGRMLYLKRPKDAFHVAEILKDRGFEVSLKGFSPKVGLKIPKGPTLYPFQEEAVTRLESQERGLVAYDMGLGKTVISLEYARRGEFQSLMVLAPGALLTQWKSEASKLFGCDQAVVINGQIEKKKRLPLYNSPFIIASYDIIKNDLKDLWKMGIKLHFDLIILDEAQKVKNWDTQRAEAVSLIVAPVVLGLSGTPVENKIEELYFIMDQIIPAYFGGFGRFKERYILTDSWGSITGYKNLEEVYDSLSEVMLRKKAEEVGEQLPKIVTMERRCNLTPNEKAFFNKIADRDKGLGTLQELKVFSSNSSIYSGEVLGGLSSKEKMFQELINDELEGRQVIVFTQFKKNVKRLESLVNEDRKVFTLTGGMKVDMKEFAEEFAKTPRAVLIMTEVGVYGLNLQSASAVVNFDLPWNPSNLKQRIGRVRRLKSAHDSVLEINLISNDSLDDYILSLLQDKIDLFDATVEGVQKTIAEKFWSDR